MHISPAASMVAADEPAGVRATPLPNGFGTGSNGVCIAASVPCAGGKDAVGLTTGRERQCGVRCILSAYDGTHKTNKGWADCPALHNTMPTISFSKRFQRKGLGSSDSIARDVAKSFARGAATLARFIAEKVARLVRCCSYERYRHHSM